MTSKRATAIEKLMENFETVKMLAKEVPFLLENVLRIRFYLNSKLYQDNKNYFSKKNANRKCDRTAPLKYTTQRNHIRDEGKELADFGYDRQEARFRFILPNWSLNVVNKFPTKINV